MTRIAGIIDMGVDGQLPPDWEWLRDSGIPGCHSHVAHPASGVWIARPGGGPVESRDGNVCAFDGRLHNRRELSGPVKSTEDGGLAVAEYETSGVGGLRRLLGDWSLAIWDGRQRTLVLASDYAGTNPLFYYWDRRRLLFSSSLEHLCRAVGAQELDQSYAAALLTFGSTNDATPFRGVRLVPCGCAVLADAQQICKKRFWTAPTAEVRLPNDAEYEERFRELFSEAVEARLQTAGTVCAELSGGLDSSSIVCMAANLINRGAVPADSLVAFRYECPETNDRPFMDAVERACQIPSIRLEIARYPALSLDSCSGPMPQWWEPRIEEVSRRMASLGSTVLLTGQMGDLIMGNWLDDSEQAADHFAAGGWRDGLSEAYAWSRSLDRPVWGILSRAALSAAGWDLGCDWERSRAASGAEDSLTSRCRRTARALNPPAAFAGRVRPSHRKRLNVLETLLSSRVLQCPASLAHGRPSHVYLHRPLVEFMMSIPAPITCRPGEPRRLMRRALRGIVPDVVLRRRSKGTYNAAFFAALQPVARLLLNDAGNMRLVRLGLVDVDSVRRRLNQLVAGLECNEPQLRQILLLELWLRRRHEEVPMRYGTRLIA